MKNDKRLIILEIIFVIIMIVAMFFNKIVTRQILAIILLIYAILNKVLVKNDKISYANSRNFTIMLTIIGLVYVGFLYFLGLFTGFYHSTVQLTFWSIINYIIPFIIIIISSEIIRKNILLREYKISKYIIVIAMIMLDIVINTNIYNLSTVNDYFTLISFIVISSIANNIFFNYSVKKFRNATAIIIYKIITTLYMYFIPITPDIYIFLESVFKLILPYIMYVIVESFFGKKDEMISTKHQRRDTIILIISIIIVVLIILLVLIGYAIFPNKEELSNNISAENTQTNIINNIHTNVSINDIPEYSGQIVIDINNNVPYFGDTDITTENFEYYSQLDEFERAGVAFANICKYTMPPEGTERGSLSYKPTGWIQYLYGENNRYHLYERCHLIAWQLGNENNNRQNLITGTLQLNDAMVEYENIVANWIKQKNVQGKDYHVLYRVTPIYDGENELATGVEIEAKSVEEDGVSFNKFIYNVQDNFEIDYRTGEAKLLE